MKSLKTLIHGLLTVWAILITITSVGLAQVDYASLKSNPALWSVSDEDSTVYIFGTVHVLPPSLDWKTDTILNAFDDAEIIYLEADIHSPDVQAQMQALLPQLGLNPAGITLSALMSDEAKANFKTYATSKGLPAETFMAQMDPVKPWLAGITLALTDAQLNGFNPQSGIELQIVAMAGDKPFSYFETAEQQLRMFSSLPDAVQLRDFEYALTDLAEHPDALPDLVKAWANGDIDKIQEELLAELPERSPELYQALFVDRNRAWIPQIISALEGDDDAFIAVGAGHMPGEQGLIKLLEEQGVTVTRLN